MAGQTEAQAARGQVAAPEAGGTAAAGHDVDVVTSRPMSSSSGRHVAAGLAGKEDGELTRVEL